LASTGKENLAGVVERVTFHNEDSGFCVLRVNARGQRDLITIVGHAAAIGARRAAGGSTIGRTGATRWAPLPTAPEPLLQSDRRHDHEAHLRAASSPPLSRHSREKALVASRQLRLAFRRRQNRRRLRAYGLSQNSNGQNTRTRRRRRFLRAARHGPSGAWTRAAPEASPPYRRNDRTWECQQHQGSRNRRTPPAIVHGHC
jgi:hypothetical protein